MAAPSPSEAGGATSGETAPLSSSLTMQNGASEQDQTKMKPPAGEVAVPSFQENYQTVKMHSLKVDSVAARSVTYRKLRQHSKRSYQLQVNFVQFFCKVLD